MKNKAQIDMMQILRENGNSLLPEDGGWVTVVGNPYAPRGYRIPHSIAELGVQHLDMYFAYNEECPWGVAGLSGRDYKFDVEEFLHVNGITDLQITKVTLHTPASQQICMWNGEVRRFSHDLIADMLQEDLLEVVPFGLAQVSPVWDEATRDMIGSLMVDGLSFAQAQDELIRGGVDLQKFYILPPYFYRAKGLYRDTFCEEED